MLIVLASALWLDSRCQDMLSRPLRTLGEVFFLGGTFERLWLKRSKHSMSLDTPFPKLF